jgi:cbb3-type cytochrome oxidase maturation protein
MPDSLPTKIGKLALRCLIFPNPIKITLHPDVRHPSAFSLHPILWPIPDKTGFNTGAMKIMLFLILVSLLLAAGFLIAYLRAARDGQFDDDYTPAIRMLFDGSVADPSPQGIEKEITQQDEDLKPSL